LHNTAAVDVLWLPFVTQLRCEVLQLDLVGCGTDALQCIAVLYSQVVCSRSRAGHTLRAAIFVHAAAPLTTGGAAVHCCLLSLLLLLLLLLLPGVTSMSVDTHKFGMAHKGTSVVLYRSPGEASAALFLMSLSHVLCLLSFCMILPTRDNTTACCTG
jgi:hypothetical protein